MTNSSIPEVFGPNLTSFTPASVTFYNRYTLPEINNDFTTNTSLNSSFPFYNNSWKTIQEQLDFYDNYVFLNTVYVLLGLLDVTFNCLVSFTVFGCRVLRNRKEMFLLGMFTASDALIGLEYVWSGARRLWLYFSNQTGLLTALQCMQVFPVNLYIYSMELMSLLLLAVSIDRFIFISNTKTHLKLGRKYLACLVVVPVLIPAASLTAVWLLVLTSENSPDQYPICFVTTIVRSAFYIYHSALLILASTSAILLYVVIMFIYRYKRELLSNYDSIKQRQIERQRRLTKSLSIMAGTTFVAFVIPNILLTFNHVFGSQSEGDDLVATQVLNVVIAMHSILNIICYLSRPSDIRKQILKNICRRTSKVVAIAVEVATIAPQIHRKKSPTCK